MTSHQPHPAYAAPSSRSHNLSAADDHQQPHNHQNLICYIHKSHNDLDFQGFAKQSAPYAAIVHKHGLANKDGRGELIKTELCWWDFLRPANITGKQQMCPAWSRFLFQEVLELAILKCLDLLYPSF